MHTDEHPAAQPVPAGGMRDRVVVGVDGSPNASAAARWAAAEAGKRGAQLLLVQALQLPDKASAPLEPYDHADHRRAQGRLLLERELERVVSEFPDLPLDAVLYDASPAHALTSLSRAAVLAVTGTRGHGGFTGMLVGSVSRKLAAHTHCPLAVVGAQASEQTPDPADGEIALGIGPAHTPAAIRFAFETAHRDRLGIRAMQTWWPNTRFEAMATSGSVSFDDLDVFREGALADTEAAVKPFEAEFPDVDVHLEIREGNAVPELVRAARKARLLVVGAHRHRGPLAVGAGYVVDGVLGRSPAPVVIVPEV
jgi:nucleotide-binding universal stress UspA family protein